MLKANLEMRNDAAYDGLVREVTVNDCAILSRAMYF